MAHTLTIGTGTSPTNLASATASSASPGIVLISFLPPGNARVRERVSSFPSIDGQRTVVENLDDTQAELIIRIYGSSADNVESQKVDLTRILQLAITWETVRSGTPVRLGFKRQGVTNTAYWTVLGFDGPEVVGSDRRWIDVETAGNFLTLRVVLTLEPTAHAGSATAIVNKQALTNVAGSNAVTSSTTTGDLPGPVGVYLQVKTGTAPTNGWFASCLGDPQINNYSGTVDADASGGQALSTTIASTTAADVGSALTYDVPITFHPLRSFVRAKVTAGTASKLQYRIKITFIGVETTYPWAAYTGTSGSYYVIDVGAVAPYRSFRARGLEIGNASIQLQVRTTDGTSVTVRTDYMEVLTYDGLVRFTGANASTTNDDWIISDNIATVAGNSYSYPRRDTRAWQANDASGDPGSTIQYELARQGALPKIPPNTTRKYWFVTQTATVHEITATAIMLVRHIPCYSLGMRGAA